MVVYFFCWLISLSIVISRSIHIAANRTISSFLMTEYYSIVYIRHNFFMHSSIKDTLVFQISWPMNCGAHMSLWIKVFWLFFFFGIYPGEGLLGPLLALYFCIHVLCWAVVPVQSPLRTYLLVLPKDLHLTLVDPPPVLSPFLLLCPLVLDHWSLSMRVMVPLCIWFTLEVKRHLIHLYVPRAYLHFGA